MLESWGFLVCKSSPRKCNSFYTRRVSPDFVVNTHSGRVTPGDRRSTSRRTTSIVPPPVLTFLGPEVIPTLRVSQVRGNKWVQGTMFRDRTVDV